PMVLLLDGVETLLEEFPPGSGRHRFYNPLIELLLAKLVTLPRTQFGFLLLTSRYSVKSLLFATEPAVVSMPISRLPDEDRLSEGSADSILIERIRFQANEGSLARLEGDEIDLGSDLPDFQKIDLKSGEKRAIATSIEALNHSPAKCLLFIACLYD